MKHRFADTVLHDGRVIEVARWHGDELVFGNPVKSKPGFRPRWASEALMMPRDSVGAIRPIRENQLLVVTEDKPWVLSPRDLVGRVSSGELVVFSAEGYQSMLSEGRLVPIYDLAFYEDRVAYWQRCDRKVSYIVPEG